MSLAVYSRLGRNVVRLGALLALLAPMVAACGSVGDSGVKRAAFTSKEFGVAVSPRVTKTKFPPRGGGRQMGVKPYVVAGKTYTPVAGPGYVARGEASWYGQDFHGRRTANGEIFGAYYLTAASPVLPIPSYARVINLENGRSVLVRVNDRGPYLQGRVMDLSYEAARQLGYVNDGHAQIEVRYVGPAPLNGDDTRMLTAAINKKTRMEMEAETRLAYAGEQPVAVAQADEPDMFAGEQVKVSGGRINFEDYQQSRGSYSGGDLVADFMGLFGYAAESPATGAAAATAALGNAEAAGPELVNTGSEELTLRLGVFRDPVEARGISEAFSMLGAVDEAVVDLGGDPAAVLTLIRLKPGVAGEDVLMLARELGLNDIVLY
jgi:rare lipoprotein A